MGKKGNKVKTGKKANSTEINKFKKKFKNGNLGEKILIVFMIGMIAITFLIILFFGFVILTAPNFDEENLYNKESSIIYYANGDEMARVGTENREIVTYDDLPEVFIDALIATEDSRFMQHDGVDMGRFIIASIGQVFGKSGAGGASTLTMQVVKQKFTSSEAEGLKGIIRKFTDVYMAVFKIEKKYTKEQIIEFYVNIPYLGGGTYGIEQASQAYFGKSISEVSLTEAALLAGLFQAPDAFDPYSSPEKAESRRNQVLNLMKRHEYITDEECEIAKAIPVDYLLVAKERSSNDNQGMVDTIIQEVEDRTGFNPYIVSMKIYSTMIAEKQAVVNNINNGTSYKWPNDQIQTGIAVIDVPTGALVAVGAGRNKKIEMGFNYATKIDRHPGSTSKPMFDFGPAIEYLNWGTGQMVIDDVFSYSSGGNIKNWDNSYKGIMTIKGALAASRNIPSVQTFQAVPQKQIKEFVTGLGLTPEYDSAGYIGEAHSIGGYTGTNPVQTAAAYATFARGGIYIEPHSFTKVEFEKSGDTYTVTPEKRTVMKDSTAYMINMILRSAVTDGHISAGSKSGTDVASKTGTSSVDSAKIKALQLKGDVIGDSWQVVYSPDYVCATWIGYEAITKEYYLTNSVGSTARRSVSQTLTAGILEPNARFKQPSSIVTATIELETEPLQLASEFTPANLKSTEYFRKGTTPNEVSKRFSKLDAPTGLKSSYTNGYAELTWSAALVPNVADSDALRGYFNDGYGRWADKYFNRRLEYNVGNIGNFGYQVYMNNGSAVTDLGWTQNTTFKYNGYITNKTTFIVKSSYSIFKANISDGVSVVVDPGVNTTVPSNNWSVEMQGNSCMNVNDFNLMQNTNQNFIKVKNNGADVTNNSSLSNTCWNSLDDDVSCTSLNSTDSYTVTHSAKYGSETKSVIRSIKSSC